MTSHQDEHNQPVCPRESTRPAHRFGWTAGCIEWDILGQATASLGLQTAAWIQAQQKPADGCHDVGLKARDGPSDVYKADAVPGRPSQDLLSNTGVVPTAAEKGGMRSACALMDAVRSSSSSSASPWAGGQQRRRGGGSGCDA
ncbi:hypothetical protein GGTG_01424 [Gaeumannomyces tritici R3-111a-1]|uniref:Uncharacterized protein n=1 Tax=Gaeumannomyces tritici (strain R3-111a-1) TaxID=644352 RepID=J3NJJ2_GAET3|nr:hypothetical protein GGTG_01424 [Gaeumannomyces tritici R3-111a-1]EJT81444.1 hypothetical protein GGTG_01424 [Gaeumannomyces tritici R3-111a-1]